MAKPKKERGGALVIDLCIYPVQVVICTDVPTFQAEIQEAFETVVPDAELGDCRGMCVNALSEHGRVVVGVFYQDPSIAAHELYHAVIAIQEYLGMSLEDSASETGAYLIQYLMKETVQYMKEEPPLGTERIRHD